MGQKTEIEFYDQRWADERPPTRLKIARAAAILDELSRLRLDAPRMIDLGCGTGWLTSVLGHFGTATGVELSPLAVERARVRFPHASYEQADFRTWQAPIGAFDVVVSQEVLEHLEDQAAYLALARRLLRDGGYLILTTPNRQTVDAMPQRLRSRWSNQPIENLVNRDELRRLLERDFAVARLTTIALGHGSGALRRVVNNRRVRALPPVAALAEWAGFGLHFVVVAQAR